MKKLIRLFAPKKVTLNLLNRLSELNADSSARLLEFLKSYHEMDRAARKVKLTEISKNKFESENLYNEFPGKARLNADIAFGLLRLNKSLSSAAWKFFLLGIERIDKNAENLAAMSNECIAELDKSVKNLRNIKPLQVHCARIHEIEEDADEMFNEAISELFHFFKNPVDIMKYKEIYEALEQVCGRCNEASYIMQKI